MEGTSGLIEAVPWDALGGIGMVALIGVAFIKGWIYPRGYVESLRADRDARLSEVREDRDTRISEFQQEVVYWREAYQEANLALVTERGKVSELLEVARTVEHVLTSLPAPLPEGGGP